MKPLGNFFERYGGAFLDHHEAGSGVCPDSAGNVEPVEMIEYHECRIVFQHIAGK